MRMEMMMVIMWVCLLVVTTNLMLNELLTATPGPSKDITVQQAGNGLTVAGVPHELYNYGLIVLASIPFK